MQHAQREYVAQLHIQLTTQIVSQVDTPALKEAAKSIAGCLVVPLFTDR